MKGTIRRCGPTNMSTLLAIVSGVLVNHQHQVLVELESIYQLSLTAGRLAAPVESGLLQARKAVHMCLEVIFSDGAA